MVGATPVALTRSSQQRQALVDAGAAHVIAGNDHRLQDRATKIIHRNVARIALIQSGGPNAASVLRGSLHARHLFLSVAPSTHAT